MHELHTPSRATDMVCGNHMYKDISYAEKSYIARDSEVENHRDPFPVAVVRLRVIIDHILDPAEMRVDTMATPPANHSCAGHIQAFIFVDLIFVDCRLPRKP